MNSAITKKRILSLLGPLITGFIVTYVMVFSLNNFHNGDYIFIEIWTMIFILIFWSITIGFILFDLKKTIKNIK